MERAAVVAGFVYVVHSLAKDGRFVDEQIVVDECKYAKNQLANVGGASMQHAIVTRYNLL